MIAVYTYLIVKTLHCCRKQIFPLQINPSIFFCLSASSIGDMTSGADVFQQWFPDVPSDDQNYPQGQQGATDTQQSNWSGEKSVGSLVGILLKCMSRGAVMEIGCDLPVVLTVEDVIAAGLCGVGVLGEHPCQGPDDDRVNGEHVPQVFVQGRIFQDEPAGNMFEIQPFEVVFCCFYTYQTSKTTVKRAKERVTASSGNIFGSLTDTMLKLTRETTVVQVAYMAKPF